MTFFLDIMKILVNNLISVLVGATMLGIGATNANSAVLTGTNFGNNQYTTGITNQTGEIVNNVKFCTPFENTSDITNSYFLAFWSINQYTNDWDNDGVAEICYEFASPGNADDMRDGDSGGVVITTSASMGPQAMRDANGGIQAWGAVNGLFIAGGENFTAEAFNPYSTIGVVSANGQVTGTGVDCGSDCSEDVYWGEDLVLSANADTNYQFDGWINCPSENGSECTVTSNGPVTVTAVFTKKQSIALQMAIIIATIQSKK